MTTNGIESVFALLKRGLHGVYHHASPKHLHRYVGEFAFRLGDGDVSQDAGRGLLCQAAMPSSNVGFLSRFTHFVRNDTTFCKAKAVVDGKDLNKVPPRTRTSARLSGRPYQVEHAAWPAR